MHGNYRCERMSREHVSEADSPGMDYMAFKVDNDQTLTPRADGHCGRGLAVAPMG